jgi:hypothetical protein
MEEGNHVAKRSTSRQQSSERFTSAPHAGVSPPGRVSTGLAVIAQWIVPVLLAEFFKERKKASNAVIANKGASAPIRKEGADVHRIR